MGNLTDLTGMTDATLDAFMAVKGGEESVPVDHLTPSERRRLCEALGVKAPIGWCDDSGPILDGPVEGRGRRFDAERAILARQEREDTEAGRY